MKTILLDSNVFDKLADDPDSRALLCRLCEEGHARLLISRTVRDELSLSPHKDLLALLPIEVVGNAAPIAGVMCAGDYLGDAEHFFQHKGASNKVSDAQVATAAQFHADWLVSDDNRLRHRQRRLSTLVETLSYGEFMEAARRLLPTR